VFFGDTVVEKCPGEVCFRQIYIEKFDVLDDTLLHTLAEEVKKWTRGIEVPLPAENFRYVIQSCPEWRLQTLIFCAFV
jgi:hypothetical protein